VTAEGCTFQKPTDVVDVAGVCVCVGGGGLKTPCVVRIMCNTNTLFGENEQYYIIVGVKGKGIKFTLQQATKAHRGSRGLSPAAQCSGNVSSAMALRYRAMAMLSNAMSLPSSAMTLESRVGRTENVPKY